MFCQACCPASFHVALTVADYEALCRSYVIVLDAAQDHAGLRLTAVAGAGNRFQMRAVVVARQANSFLRKLAAHPLHYLLQLGLSVHAAGDSTLVRHNNHHEALTREKTAKLENTVNETDFRWLPNVAIVMIDHKSQKQKDFEAVASGIRMQGEGDIADPEEIKLARMLLITAIKLLAQSLERNVRANHSFLTDKHKTLLAQYFGKLTPIDATRRVFIPCSEDDIYHNMRVRKIKFVGQTGHGHPSPDPILLVVKAAVVWTTYHNQQLLAGGEVDNDESDLSVLAEEEFLRHREFVRRSQPLTIDTISIPAFNQQCAK